MAKFADVNTIQTLHTPCILKLKTVLKLAGWTVPTSSDGTTYSSSADVISHDSPGAGGLGNASAWFVVREPGGRREWCFQRVTTDSVWRVKYSAFAKFSGGVPGIARVPSATDEQVLVGAGTDAAPTGGGFFSGTWRVHIVANSTPIGGVYPFVLFTTTTPGAAQANGLIFQEPMAPGSYSVADVDPCVVCAGSGTTPTAASTRFWLAYGTASVVWISAATAIQVGDFTGAMPVDLASGDDVNGRPYYTGTSAGIRIKGYGSTLLAKGPARTYPATANTLTDGYCYLGSFVYPYPDNTVPGV